MPTHVGVTPLVEKNLSVLNIFNNMIANWAKQVKIKSSSVRVLSVH